MAPDSRGTQRGQCLTCSDCKEFESWNKSVRCAYCDCPPTKHECLDQNPENMGNFQDIQEQTQTKTTEAKESGEQVYSPFVQLFEGATGREQDVHRDAQAQEDANNRTSAGILPSNGTLQSKTTVPDNKLARAFKCGVCQRRFTKLKLLRSHILLHRGRKQYKCLKCKNVMFPTLDALLQHRKLHRNDNNAAGAVEGNSIYSTTTLTPRFDMGPKLGRLNQSTKIKKRPVSKNPIANSSPVTTTRPNISVPVTAGVWGSPTQGTFQVNPLTGSLDFVPQVTIPASAFLQGSGGTLNRGFQGLTSATLSGANSPQKQALITNQINLSQSINQQILNQLQLLDAKLASIPQLDRKLDYILHYLNVPRQVAQDAPHFTVESDETIGSPQPPQLPGQLDLKEDAEPSPRVLAQTLHERIEFDRTSFDPSTPIPDSILNEVYKSSVSRRNFAKNLVFLVFDHDEMKGRNCSGKVYGKGEPKERLNSTKLHAVKVATFKKYPCDPTEAELVWQRECVKAIDKAIRSRALQSPRSKTSNGNNPFIEDNKNEVHTLAPNSPQMKLDTTVFIERT